MSLKTLVVDDSPTARAALKQMLEKVGIRVDQTSSGSEALRYLKDHTPDLIFMDHSMPGMNGLETTQAITNNPVTAKIPVVMYTSQEGQEYLEKALAHGAIDLVSKPVSLEKIMYTIFHLMNAQRIEQRIMIEQINKRFEQLQQDMEDLVEQKVQEATQKASHPLPPSETTPPNTAKQHIRELMPLVHSITDSKLHQLNIEIRNYIAAKFDVLSQDLRIDQTEQQPNQENQADHPPEESATPSARLAEHPKRQQASRSRWWSRLINQRISKQSSYRKTN